MTQPLASTAPGYDPAAVDLPWWRRSLAQGAGYMLPSTAFLAIPIVFTATGAPGRLPFVIAGALAVTTLAIWGASAWFAFQRSRAARLAQ